MLSYIPSRLPLWVSCCLFGTLIAHSQTVYISEFVASNDESLLDEDGVSSDWIELYNSSDTEVDLTGWHLTDQPDSLNEWSFPATTLPAKSFLTIFASNKDRAIAGQELHTNFKLSASGEYIALVQPDGTTIEDDHTFGAQNEDISYGYSFSGGTATVVLDAGASCSALVPSSSDDSEGWNELPTPPITGWISGSTGVGYDTGTDYLSLINLDVSSMYDTNASVYIRVPFTISDVTQISQLSLRMKYDDGFIAYINGEKVAASSNAPLTPVWNSESTGAHQDEDAIIYQDYDISGSISELQDGSNVLAIHGLNKPADSLDMLIVPRLEAVTSNTIDSADIGHLATPTPNAPNSLIGYEGYIGEVSALPARGFYDSGINVSLSNPTSGTTIHYTTDGTDPTTSSPQYSSALSINSTTTLRTKAFRNSWSPSATRTDSYIFVDNVVTVPKSTAVINGQYMEYGMDSDVLAKTYYDANGQLVTVQDALKAIPTLSITTDPDHLYSPETGIYVNAVERWERPASLELINPDGSEGFQVNFGLRIRGGWSRHSNFEKHSFRCLFKQEYGAGKLKYAMFEDEGVDSFDNLDLRTAQNYNWASSGSSSNTFLRDISVRDTQGATGHAYTRSRYYHLYLNGAYWGLYMTEERPEASFAASYHGGNSEDYDVIKVASWTEDNSRQREVTDGNLEAYNRLYHAAMVGFRSNANYFAVQGMDSTGAIDPTKERLVDIENLIDHQLLIYYYAAKDNGITAYGWDRELNNMYAFYNREKPDGFKWVMHDIEHSMDVVSGDHLDRTGPFDDRNFELPEYFNAQTLHEKLSLNSEYKLKFSDRVYKLMKTDGEALDTAMLEARFDARAAQIDRAIVANAARWGSTSLDRDTWVSATATARDFYSSANARADVVIRYFYDDRLLRSSPPQLNTPEGLVTSGTLIELTASQGTIYYTTDGTDPRAIGGAISGSTYSSPISITKPTQIKARSLFSSGSWSALCEGVYLTEDIPLAVTELMYHAPEGNSHDLIELQNISRETVTLKGYKIDDGIEFKFKNSGFTSLAPGEIMVVVDDIDAFNAKYPNSDNVLVAGEFSGDLSDAGEEIDLEFSGEDLINFTYDDARNWPQAADGGGHSLIPLDSAMHDQERGSLNYGGNWRASTDLAGSPGEIDPQLDPTVMLNEVTAHTDTGNTVPFDSNDVIELYNPTANPISLDGWYLSDDLSDQMQWPIPNGTVIPAFGFVAFDEDDFHTDRVNGFGLNKAGEEVILSTATRVVDSIRFKGQENGSSYGRYPDGSDHWMATQPTRSAPNSVPAASLQISSIMYHPLTSGEDYEYIQIQNVSLNSINLKNATGNYRIDGDIEFTFPTDTIVPAGNTLWLVSFDPSIDTALLALFGSTYGITPANETILGPYSGKLSNKAGRVAIERPQDSDDLDKPLDISWVVVDEAYYSDQSPWPANTDGTGFALVRTGLNSWGALTSDDTDADGMADSWELSYFGSLNQNDSNSDSDQFSNFEEYIADTDPKDGSSYFSVAQTAPATLTWSTKSGRVYSVYWTDDLSQPFQLIATGLTSGNYTDPDHTAYESNFYCIRVELE